MLDKVQKSNKATLSKKRSQEKSKTGILNLSLLSISGTLRKKFMFLPVDIFKIAFKVGQCDKCGKSFRSRLALRRHLYSHIDQECAICKIQFPSM